MEYYIDEKCTIWNRITFHSEEEFLCAINELKETEEYDVPINISQELLIDTIENMSIEDNQGWATRECMKDGELIYANGNH